MAESTKTLKAILTATETVSEALEDVSDGLREVSTDSEVAEEAMESVSSAAAKITSSARGAASSTRELDEELDDVSTSSVKTSASLATLIPSLKAVEQSADEAEDEVSHLEQAMDKLGVGALATSLNIGPFNFALKNLFTLLPQLIMAVGALTVALGGLAAAATAAAVSFGLIFGGGVLMVAESLAATSGDIEDRMEAMEEILTEIVDLFVEAMEPLQNTLSVRMFEDFIEGLALALHMIVDAVADVQERLAAFQDNFGQQFFESFTFLVEETTLLLVELLPYIAEFAALMNNLLARSFAFIRKEFHDFYPVLQNFGSSLREFIRVFTELGITILQGILPVVGAVLDMISMFADVLNRLPDSFVSTTMAILTLIYVGKRLYRFGQTLSEVVIHLGKHYQEKFTNMIDRTQVLRNEMLELVNSGEAFAITSDKIQKELQETAIASGVASESIDEMSNSLDRVSSLDVESHAVAEGVETDDANGLKSRFDKGGLLTAALSALLSRINAVRSALSRFSSAIRQRLLGDMGELNDAVEETGSSLDNLKEKSMSLPAPTAVVTSRFGGLRGVLSKLASTIKTVLLTPLGMLRTVLGAIAGIVTTTAGITAMFVGIPAIILGMRHMDTILGGISDTLSWIGDFFMTMLVPLWNMLVDLTELLLSPFLAIADGVEMIASAFSPVINFFDSVLGDAATVFMFIAELVGSIFSLVGSIADVFSDTIYTVITAIAGVTRRAVQIVMSLLRVGKLVADIFIDWLTNTRLVQTALWIVTEIVNGLKSAFESAVSYIAGLIDRLTGGIVNFINWVIGGINDLIEKANMVPGVNIDTISSFDPGDSTPASEALEEQKKDAESEMAPGQTVINNNVTNNEYNFGDFNMLPEEKARVKGLVQDALREAQRNKRLEGGHIG